MFECYWIVSVCHSRYSSLSCNNFGNQMVALICWPRELTAVLTTQSTTCYETDNYPLNYRQAVLKGRFLIELTSLFGFSTKLDGLKRKKSNSLYTYNLLHCTCNTTTPPPRHLLHHHHQLQHQDLVMRSFLETFNTWNRVKDNKNRFLILNNELLMNSRATWLNLFQSFSCIFNVFSE